MSWTVDRLNEELPRTEPIAFGHEDSEPRRIIVQGEQFDALWRQPSSLLGQKVQENHVRRVHGRRRTGAPTYDTVAAHGDDIAVIIPPHVTGGCRHRDGHGLLTGNDVGDPSQVAPLRHIRRSRAETRRL